MDEGLQKPEIRGMRENEIAELLLKNGAKSFQGRQVFSWVQDKAVRDWEEMRNISAKMRCKLADLTELRPLKLLTERVSKDGTRKYLWGLADGEAVECVLLYHTGDITKKRYTMCLSTQVGCSMGCTFCATGKMGFRRNLTTGEIVSQVLDTTNLMRSKNPDFKVSNLVYMGMGEPLLNLEAVIKSIKILNEKKGQDIGIRRITVSTCGIVPKIRELAQSGLNIVLAVSLHAPTNEQRSTIMPVNNTYPLEKLLAACRFYEEKTRRRITFEYALIKGFNDGIREAKYLAALLRGLSANVNIIPVNTNSSFYHRPSKSHVIKFKALLCELGINAVVREEKGADIEAACGQLAGVQSEVE